MATQEQVVGEASFASAVTNIPEAHDPMREHDYKASAEAYKNYWTTCIDAYVFSIEEKKSISIDKLVAALADMNIRSHEDRLASDVLHYLVHMPDKTTKQTLCVMPTKLMEKPKPEDWDKIAKGEFFLINGQQENGGNAFG